MTTAMKNPRHGINVTGVSSPRTYTNQFAQDSAETLTAGEITDAQLDIATAPRQESKKWFQRAITWGDLLAWMETPADVKECGGYVLGRLSGGERKKHTVIDRCALTLDADGPQAGFLDRLKAELGECAAVIHTTNSSTAGQPRYRIIVPLAGPLSPDAYRAAVTELMRRIDQGGEFDAGSSQPERFMWRPSVQKTDGEFWFEVLEGPLLDASALALDGLLNAPEKESGASAGELVLPRTAEEIAAAAAYVGAAIQDEAGLLALTLDHRNDRLNKAALKLGHYAWLEEADSPIISKEAVWEALEEACHENGLMSDPDDGPVKTRGTFESGWGDGEAKPHPLPERTTTTSATDTAEEDGIPSGGWEPIDLTPYLDGTFEPPVPTVLRRTDGLALMYAGMTHSFHGESESGKSMIVQGEAAALLADGQRVLYLDYEADPGSVAHRLVMMGAPAARVGDQAYFTYIQPEGDYDNTPESRAAFARLLDREYALAVVDGVTEALTQAQAKLRSTGGLGGNDDITAWHNHLPRRIARRTGAAVVQIDHVAKSAETTRFAIGGQAKMATITGAAYYVKPLSPLAKGQVGEVEIHVAKDRHGYVRSRAEGPFDLKTRMQLVAVAVVDGRHDRIVVELLPPVSQPDNHDAHHGADPDLMERVSTFLMSLPEDHKGAGKTLIRQNVRGKNERIDEALDALVAGKYVARRVEGQGIYHRLARPFLSDLEEDGAGQ